MTLIPPLFKFCICIYRVSELRPSRSPQESSSRSITLVWPSISTPTSVSLVKLPSFPLREWETRSPVSWLTSWSASRRAPSVASRSSSRRRRERDASTSSLTALPLRRTPSPSITTPRRCLSLSTSRIFQMSLLLKYSLDICIGICSHIYDDSLKLFWDYLLSYIYHVKIIKILRIMHIFFNLIITLVTYSSPQ